MFKFFNNCGNLDMSDENKSQKLKDQEIFISPFESQSKTSTIVYRSEENFVRVCMKGATEIMKDKCSRILMEMDAQNEEESPELDEDMRNKIDTIIKDFSTKRLRTIMVAYKQYPIKEFIDKFCPTHDNFDKMVEYYNNSKEKVDTINERRVEVEKDLIIQAIFGIADPTRGTAGHSVNELKNAGITVRMVTGDSREASHLVAEQCGILARKKVARVVQSPRRMPKVGMAIQAAMAADEGSLALPSGIRRGSVNSRPGVSPAASPYNAL